MKYRSDEEPLVNERRSSWCRPRFIQFILLLLLCVVAYIFFWSHSTRKRNYELESENLFYKKAYRNASIQNAVWKRRLDQLQGSLQGKQIEVESCQSTLRTTEARRSDCQQQLDGAKTDGENLLNNCKDELAKCHSESHSYHDKSKLELETCQRQLKELSQAQRNIEPNKSLQHGTGGAIPPSQWSGDQQGKFGNSGMEQGRMRNEGPGQYGKARMVTERVGNGGLEPGKFGNGGLVTGGMGNGGLEPGPFGSGGQGRMRNEGPGQYGKARMEPGRIGGGGLQPGKFGGSGIESGKFGNGGMVTERVGNGGLEPGKFGNGGLVTGGMGNGGLEPGKFGNGGQVTGRMGNGGLEPGKQSPIWPSLNMQKKKDSAENQETLGISKESNKSINSTNEKNLEKGNQQVDPNSQIVNDRINQGQRTSAAPSSSSESAGSDATKEKNPGVSPPSINSGAENKPTIGQSLNQLNAGKENKSNDNDKSKQLNNENPEEISRKETKDGNLLLPANGQGQGRDGTKPGKDLKTNDTTRDPNKVTDNYDDDDDDDDYENLGDKPFDNKAPVGQGKGVSPPSEPNKTATTPGMVKEKKNLPKNPDYVPDDDEKDIYD